MCEGLCTGLAAYSGIHVAFVRIAFLLLVVRTAGFGLIGYWILASGIPEAQTADERAAAHGQPPFNAQELIDRTRTNYAAFADNRGWGRNWRSERRAWRRQRRDGEVLGIAGALWFIVFAWAVYSLVTTGQVLGEPLPDDLPLWGGIVILVMACHVVAWPLHFARRRAAYYSFGGMHPAVAAGDGMLSLLLAGLMFWLA